MSRDGSPKEVPRQRLHLGMGPGPMCPSLASPEKASPAFSCPTVSCNVSFPCSVQGFTTLCTPLHVGPASIAPPGNPLPFCLSSAIAGRLSLPPGICSPEDPCSSAKRLPAPSTFGSACRKCSAAGCPGASIATPPVPAPDALRAGLNGSACLLIGRCQAAVRKLAAKLLPAPTFLLLSLTSSLFINCPVPNRLPPMRRCSYYAGSIFRLPSKVTSSRMSCKPD